MSARAPAAVLALLALAVLLGAGPGWAAPRCEPWIAVLASAQGTVEVRARNEQRWMASRVGDPYCVGDTVRVGDRSRAALQLRDDAVIRLDQNTTLTVAEPRGVVTASWIDLRDLRGIVHFISRLPRRLGVLTPFVNGTIEGTEFWVEVAADRATINVFEGLVAAENPQGRLEIGSGQAALAERGQPPRPVRIPDPRQRIQWTRFYPAITDDRAADYPDLPGQTWPAAVRRAIEASSRGDHTAAFAALDQVDASVADPRFLASGRMLLGVGRVDEARATSSRAAARHGTRRRSPCNRSSPSCAGDTAAALADARDAVAADPRSPVPRIALSYAQQAGFDLAAALATLMNGPCGPDNALAWARLAECTSRSDAKEALGAAGAPARCGPIWPVPRPSGVRPAGESRKGGRGGLLARDLARSGRSPAPTGAGPGADPARRARGRPEKPGGRRQPGSGNSLVRSYLGKALHEERRNDLAAKEFAIAKELDPKDPTPWFYDAISEQTHQSAGRGAAGLSEGDRAERQPRGIPVAPAARPDSAPER